jgi:hypothetical protein
MSDGRMDIRPPVTTLFPASTRITGVSSTTAEEREGRRRTIHSVRNEAQTDSFEAELRPLIPIALRLAAGMRLDSPDAEDAAQTAALRARAWSGGEWHCDLDSRNKVVRSGGLRPCPHDKCQSIPGVCPTVSLDARLSIRRPRTITSHIEAHGLQFVKCLAPGALRVLCWCHSSIGQRRPRRSESRLAAPQRPS